MKFFITITSPDPYDIDDIFRDMGSKTKVTDHISLKYTFRPRHIEGC